MAKKLKWGIIGIGKLGTALLTQFEKQRMQTGIYHPDYEKTVDKATNFAHAYAMRKKDITSVDILLLVLPADKTISFIEECLAEGLNMENVLLINMATKLQTTELKEKFPQLQWQGIKLIGHAESLRQNGAGLFVTEKKQEGEAENLFAAIGELVEDNESVVEEVNKLTTLHAVKAARKLEQTMQEEGYASVYTEQALRAVLPEVVRAYSKGELGQFAKKIVEEMEEK
ncbi:NAD(P)-binding domain-containing protein [Alkalicoccus daliensis]|uniref:NAD binding domain of 6-phosphogluconate dehydrogenase n=1 Tax=Alkalicoccus daliensis TaxID=745820 RepID=A0A1H0G9N9_9BACI|nr:NAD(P)-binding domain-containing protein [Alkalicoccus daliensis]SDO03602.1 NAD binding domain of 6-phosphogluconate dehydrogenase [Alkalicoccus daliensis]